jgi:16S rRNA (uracil1498-N3)-methyltransferase
MRLALPFLLRYNRLSQLGTCLMRITRLYQNTPLNLDTPIALDARNCHHLLTVLRYQAGDPCILFNGNGHDYQGKIASITKKQCTVILHDKKIITNESSLSVELLFALIKPEKVDWLLQKTTELGVAHITPVLTEYCECKLKGERLQKKMQHWQQVIIHAAEQSGRARIPSFSPPLSLNDSLKENTTPILYFHPSAAQSLSTFSLENITSVKIVIGPEGGLSDADESILKEYHAQALNLGPRILRAETAAIVGVYGVIS